MKKLAVFFAFIMALCLSGCGKEADKEQISLIGTDALEPTAPAYAEITELLERQRELEVFMETAWFLPSENPQARKEGLDTWADFEAYAQEVYTKEYVDDFFTPKYFGEDGSYYYLDEQGNLVRRESDGIVYDLRSNTLLKLTKAENAYAVIQEYETDDAPEHRICLIVRREDGVRIYAQIEE